MLQMSTLLSYETLCLKVSLTTNLINSNECNLLCSIILLLVVSCISTAMWLYRSLSRALTMFSQPYRLDTPLFWVTESCHLSELLDEL